MTKQVPGRVHSRAEISPHEALLLERIEQLSAQEMLTAWQERFGAPPRCASQPQLFRLLLGNRLQEMSGTKISWQLRQRLSALIEAYQRDPDHEPTANIRLKPGLELVRVWNGVAHRVWVLPNGYLWNGHLYKSLTKITREITGTSWSGPSFFKLKRRTAL